MKTKLTVKNILQRKKQKERKKTTKAKSVKRTATITTTRTRTRTIQKIPYFINKSCTCQNSAPRTNGSSKTSTEEQKQEKTNKC